MFWKIIGVIAALWLAFLIVSVLVKALFPLAILGLVVIGIVTVVKWLGSGKKTTV
ncbi:hypothetical protein [Tsukamurella soli]|uniref:Uncharacterized protein n=1 Tax=Tsukamurella soli TaxID=644556 RepID=A0ABP8JM61_9ACTN